MSNSHSWSGSTTSFLVNTSIFVFENESFVKICFCQVANLEPWRRKSCRFKPWPILAELRVLSSQLMKLRHYLYRTYFPCWKIFGWICNRVAVLDMESKRGDLDHRAIGVDLLAGKVAQPSERSCINTRQPSHIPFATRALDGTRHIYTEGIPSIS